MFHPHHDITLNMIGKNYIEKDGIIINRMYAGDYLDSNIGHEVINLFAADNGCHYLYLNATGNFAEEHKDRINWMVLVKRHCSGIDEIVGLAEELTDVYVPDKPFNNKYDDIDKDIFEAQKAYCKKEGGVTYGGVGIFDVFGNAGQQSIFITYKAEKLFVPKDKRLFICYANYSGDNVIPGITAKDVIIRLNGYKQANMSLKQYIYSTDNCADHNALVRLFKDNSLWKESYDKAHAPSISDLKKNEVSLFDICNIQNDENCFSNALAYFMNRPEYHGLWKAFFQQYHILLSNLSVTREESAVISDANYNKKHPGGGRIDLLIHDDSNMIVIENKIKSDINDIESDVEGKQLERYYNYVNWLLYDTNAKSKVNTSFFVLTPNYNIPKLSGEMANIYRIITYKDLYVFLEKNLSRFENDANFVALFNAIYRHTFGNVCDYLYHEMKSKFFRQIKDNKH